MLFLAGLSGRYAKDAEWTEYNANECFKNRPDWITDYEKVISSQDSTISTLNELIRNAEMESGNKD